ncbi:MAG: hypothetical protein SVV80_12255 [Planctomycetota bacterium]|nr:hypothetical protein [Planctomycetota bacterium]
MEQRKTKTCAMCFEEIDERARKCPHCRSLQAGISAWLSRNPAAILLIVLIGVLFLFGGRGLWGSFLNSQLVPTGQNDLRTFKGEVKVVSSKMVFGKSEEGPVVCVIGQIKNESEIAWKDLQIVAQFFDQSGELIDVAIGPEYYFASEILPHGEGAFKVRVIADFPKETYASYKINVRSATDVRKFP